MTTKKKVNKCPWINTEGIGCYPLEIIGKDEKGTGKFICLYCNLPVELNGLEEYLENRGK